MIYDIAIIGAGASGLMTATRINGKKIAIIDGNREIGAKIKVSGGGKCNVTNEIVTTSQYDGDSQLISNTLQKFSNKNLLEFLKQKGVVPTKQNRVVNNQYFCNSSQEILTLFKKITKHVTYRLREPVVSVTKKDLFSITTTQREIRAKNVVVATGGKSFPQLGASEIGYTIAKSFGHTITNLSPALVGFTTLPEQRWVKDLSGLSTEVEVTVNDKKIRGNILCAHKGISGPAIMVASLYWRKGKISIDFLPNTAIKTILTKNKNRNISTALQLPKRFAKALLHALGLTDKKIAELTKEEIQQLHQVKNYEFAPAGTFGFKRAEVTRGGITTDEINHSTFESTLVKGLFFVGEVLDVTGELGGYNLQWAFSSGYVCGNYLNNL